MPKKFQIKQTFAAVVLGAAMLSVMPATAGAQGVSPSSPTARTAHAATRRFPASTARCTRNRRSNSTGSVRRARHGYQRQCGSSAKASTAVASIAQLHTETWAYDDCGNGGAAATAAVMRAWVTYAEAACGPGGDSKALSDCRSGSTVYCNVIQYLDTNWIYLHASPPWNAFSGASSESWYQHTPGSQTARVETRGYGGGYLIDQSQPAVQSFFQNYVHTNYNADDGLMMDDQASSMSSLLYYSACGCSTSNEVGSADALRTAHESMSAAMTHSSGAPFTQIDNTLPPNPYLPQGFDMLSQSTGTQGLISEGAPESGGHLDPYYSTLLDQIAYVANKTSSFVVPLSYGAAGASYQQQSRRVQEATILLGYSPGHLVDWADLEQGSKNAAVWPEQGIYPTSPVQSMQAPGGTGCFAGTGAVCSTGGHNDLEVSTGVYRREFGACYDHGVLFGACASIVNTTGRAVIVKSSWLTTAYRHQVRFDGGDVQSGGTINLAVTAFRPGATTVASHDATLLAP